jgi:site-specific DNA-methyltransferase (adenine-specific)
MGIKIYYSEKGIKLIRGDCLEVMDSMIKQGIKVDMVLTDPPYGTTACKWDSVIPPDQMWDRINKITKENSAICLFGREPFTSTLVVSNIKNYKHKWVWNKKQSGSFQNAKYMPLQIEEDIVVFANGKVNYYPQMRQGKMRKRGGAKEKSRVVGSGLQDGYESYSDLYYPVNIIEFANPRTGKLHPTQKPVEILEILISNYTNEGDIILDFTCGSGSTLVAAKKLNRKCFGIELEEKYCEIAKQRLIELGSKGT